MSVFKPGDRVEFAPHTDRWMRGDRYATVIAVNVKGHGKRTVHVLSDKDDATYVVPGILTLVER